MTPLGLSTVVIAIWLLGVFPATGLFTTSFQPGSKIWMRTDVFYWPPMMSWAAPAVLADLLRDRAS